MQTRAPSHSGMVFRHDSPRAPPGVHRCWQAGPLQDVVASVQSALVSHGAFGPAAGRVTPVQAEVSPTCLVPTQVKPRSWAMHAAPLAASNVAAPSRMLRSRGNAPKPVGPTTNWAR